jgi:hypothetical protein
MHGVAMVANGILIDEENIYRIKLTLLGYWSPNSFIFFEICTISTETLSDALSLLLDCHRNTLGHYGLDRLAQYLLALPEARKLIARYKQAFHTPFRNHTHTDNASR